MTDKVTLNYLLIYALAVPYYLFFNVESLLLGFQEWRHCYTMMVHIPCFYATHDPLDNAVPSLHVVIHLGS